jgi:beta-glucanase (GH16 family)
MSTVRLRRSTLWFVAAVALVPAARAEGPAPGARKPLLDFSAGSVEKRVAPTYGANRQVSLAGSQDPAAPGLAVTIRPGRSGYPGIEIKPEGERPWDLSAFGRVEARVVNTGSDALALCLRVDNEGDWRSEPWNAAQISLRPGAAGTIRVIFGYSYGHKANYALKPAAVTKILLFAVKADAVQSFRLESLAAAGRAGETPPLDPQSVRIKPRGGVLLGPGVKIDPAAQIEAPAGVQTSLAAATAGGPPLRAVFPATAEEQSIVLKPAQGRWDLGEAFEVRVQLKNEGQTPLVASVQLTSNGGPSDRAAAAPLPPGATREIVVPFAAAVPFRGVRVSKAGHFGGQQGTGTTFTSDAVGGVRIFVRHQGQASLGIQSIAADAPAAVLPEWLGKRPPAPGDWVKTLDDDFDGRAIDPTVWNIYGPNYWDQKTHWSKDNLIVADGVAKFHFEKKPGFHNDDPRQHRTEYACGFLETYGKWVQRYGYFEARVKLPTAPGLWPTFWLMPDRGIAAGPHQDRQDTGQGGMEFDIMEHLTRWGPYRYNIALHWDGYGKSHKALGSASNYVQADKDGFITSGLLWTPGSAIFYGNGRELWRWEDPRVSSVPSGIIIEITTGGWDNNAVDDARLPADYLIDYVRVWQRRDLASDVDGKQPPAKAQPR